MPSCHVLEGEDHPFQHKKTGESAISLWTRREASANRKGAQFSRDKALTLEKISQVSLWPDPILLSGGRREEGGCFYQVAVASPRY